MQDSFSILSPAGYVMDVGIVPSVNGTGTYGSVFVSKLLPGGLVQARGRGEYSLEGRLSGRQGTMQINCITGTDGASQAVAFIAVSPTLLLGVAVDATNRPYALLVDILGNLVGQSEAMGPALPAGTPLTIELAWDSQNVVRQGDHAAFQFNDQIADWGATNVPVWIPFVPTKLYVGTSLGGYGLLSFTGIIGKVQIGDTVTFVTVVGASEAEDLGDNADLYGESDFAADAGVIWDASVDSSGVSDLASDANVTLAGEADYIGDSDLAAAAGLNFEVDVDSAGSSDLGADATGTWAVESAQNGEANVTAEADVAWDASVDASGASDLAAAAGLNFEVDADASGSSDLTADANVAWDASADASGSSDLTANSDVAWDASADASGSSAMTADGEILP
jgi:hypothetical protein